MTGGLFCLFIGPSQSWRPIFVPSSMPLFQVEGREVMCWCGKKHDRGDIRNGEVRHFVSNWSLYQLRTADKK